MSHPLKIAILHGWAAGPELFTDVKQQLETQGHFVSLYEMPGYGSRRDVPACSTFEQLADDAIDSLHSCNVWIGWSMGAMIALKAASQRPRSLSALMVVCGTAKFIGDQAKNDSLVMLRESVQQNPAKAMLRFQRSLPSAENRRRIAKSLDPEVPSKETLLRGLDILERADLRDELNKIDLPVSLISGSEDLIIPAAAGEAIAASIPESNFHSLPCGHLPFLECREPFMEHLFEFIETTIKSNADRKSV